MVNFNSILGILIELFNFYHNYQWDHYSKQIISCNAYFLKSFTYWASIDFQNCVLFGNWFRSRGWLEMLSLVFNFWLKLERFSGKASNVESKKCFI